MIESLKPEEEVEFRLVDYGQGRATVLAVDAVAVRLRVYPKTGPDEDMVYPWHQIASIRVLQGVVE